jgi:hypothetical protein
MRRSLVLTQEHVHSRRLFEPREISVYHLSADQVQVQIILLCPLISRTDRPLTHVPRHILSQGYLLARLMLLECGGHTERLSNLVTRGKEAEVDKCG